MLRIKLAVVILSLVLAFYGFQEYNLGKNASAQPEAVTVEELSKGIPTNPYRSIKKHTPVPQAVFREKKGGTIEYTYYPIVSDNDPVLKMEQPKLTKVSVLVKTKRFKTEAELQKALDADNGLPTEVTGMVVNEVDNLRSDEIDLLKKSYPAFDEKFTVLFEEGRTPSGTGSSLAMMAGGLLGALLGVLWMIMGRTSNT